MKRTIKNEEKIMKKKIIQIKMQVIKSEGEQENNDLTQDQNSVDTEYDIKPTRNK